jgi:hypothetical protein
VICRVCGEEFHPKKNHPGYINVCLEEECRTNVNEPKTKLLTACVSWDKTTMLMEIVSDPEVSERHNTFRSRMGMQHQSFGNL